MPRLSLVGGAQAVAHAQLLALDLQAAGLRAEAQHQSRNDGDAQHTLEDLARCSQPSASRTASLKLHCVLLRHVPSVLVDI